MKNLKVGTEFGLFQTFLFFSITIFFGIVNHHSSQISLSIVGSTFAEIIYTSDFLNDLIFRPIFNSIFDFPPIKNWYEISFFQQQTMNFRNGLSFLITYIFYSIIFYKTGKWIYEGFKKK